MSNSPATPMLPNPFVVQDSDKPQMAFITAKLESLEAPCGMVSGPLIAQVNTWQMPELPDLKAPVELPYATDGLAPEQIEILTVWENTKKQLDTLKKFEMECRKVIVYDSGFFDINKTSGTEHVALPGGYDLVSVKKENYKLTNANNETDEALEHFSEDMAAMLVKWTPDLSVSTFKKLTEEQQAFFDKALEIKNGAPTLEIKAPKVKS